VHLALQIQGRPAFPGFSPLLTHTFPRCTPPLLLLAHASSLASVPLLGMEPQPQVSSSLSHPSLIQGPMTLPKVSCLFWLHLSSSFSLPSYQKPQPSL
jgi:hypothetical protein